MGAHKVIIIAVHLVTFEEVNWIVTEFWMEELTVCTSGAPIVIVAILDIFYTHFWWLYLQSDPTFCADICQLCNIDIRFHFCFDRHHHFPDYHFYFCLNHYHPEFQWGPYFLLIPTTWIIFQTILISGSYVVFFCSIKLSILAIWPWASS